jgi:hypothetical protein
LRCKDCQKKRPWAKIVLAQTQQITAAASIEQQKQLLHEKLFCFIEKHPTVCATNWNGEVPIAAQITGMIVHSLEIPELLSLYEAPDNLHAKVIEVVSMLVESWKAKTAADLAQARTQKSPTAVSARGALALKMKKEQEEGEVFKA